jgi:hypothetical protein
MTVFARARHRSLSKITLIQSINLSQINPICFQVFQVVSSLQALSKNVLYATLTPLMRSTWCKKHYYYLKSLSETFFDIMYIWEKNKTIRTSVHWNTLYAGLHMISADCAAPRSAVSIFHHVCQEQIYICKQISICVVLCSPKDQDKGNTYNHNSACYFIRLWNLLFYPNLRTIMVFEENLTGNRQHYVCGWPSSAVKMETISFSETLLSTYKCTGITTQKTNITSSTP